MERRSPFGVIGASLRVFVLPLVARLHYCLSQFAPDLQRVLEVRITAVKKPAVATPPGKTAAPTTRRKAGTASTTTAAAKPAPKKAAPQKKVAAKKSVAKKPAKAPAATKPSAKQAPVKPAATKQGPVKPSTKPAATKQPAAKATKPAATKAAPARKAAAKTSGSRADAANEAARTAAAALIVAEDESPWTPSELAQVAAELRSDVERLTVEVAHFEHDFTHLIKGGGDGAGDDQADVGTMNVERDHELSLADNSRAMLEQSQHALERIADGSYGICESCGKAVGKLRLQAFPRATLCMACKQKQERR